METAQVPHEPEDSMETVDVEKRQPSAAALERKAELENMTVEEMEEQADIAADYLEELLDIADIDGDLDIEVKNNRPCISITHEEDDEELKPLVGQNAQVMNALQELVRLAVQQSSGKRTRLILDINGFRNQRLSNLEKLAQKAIDAVKESNEEVELEPMGSYERKYIHDLISEAGLVSESEGLGRGRHIVVKPVS
jgi:spoIIIJ-associated protein